MSPLRPESSVSLGWDDFGALVFDGDKPGPVIHRTPEELGIAREVKDAPRVPSWFKPSTDTGRMFVRNEYRDRGAKKLVKAAKLTGTANRMQHAAKLRVIGGVDVVIAPAAQMGAEPLDGFIAERQKQEEMMKPLGRKDSMSADTQAGLVADASTLNIDQLCAKYAVKQWKVYAVLAAHNAHCVSKPLGRIHNNQGMRRVLRAPRPVEIDPERPGSASALVNALDKIDADVEKFRVDLELSQAELSQVLRLMRPDQRSAFLSAGLRAALLA